MIDFISRSFETGDREEDRQGDGNHPRDQVHSLIDPVQTS